MSMRGLSTGAEDVWLLQFLNVVVSTTLLWSPSSHIAAFYALAGAAAIVVNTVLFRRLAAALGLLRLGMVASLQRGLAWLVFPALILFVRDNMPGAWGVGLIMATGLLITIAHTILSSFQSVLLMVRFSPSWNVRGMFAKYSGPRMAVTAQDWKSKIMTFSRMDRARLCRLRRHNVY
jgi:hypothetical protein